MCWTSIKQMTSVGSVTPNIFLVSLQTFWSVWRFSFEFLVWIFNFRALHASPECQVTAARGPSCLSQHSRLRDPRQCSPKQWADLSLAGRPAGWGPLNGRKHSHQYLLSKQCSRGVDSPGAWIAQRCTHTHALWVLGQSAVTASFP